MSAQPPARAVDNGHTLEWDPPHGLSSAARWTCTTCGEAALRAYGNEYGGAVEEKCTGSQPQADDERCPHCGDPAADHCFECGAYGCTAHGPGGGQP